jgi:hypothetical protein
LGQNDPPKALPQQPLLDFSQQRIRAAPSLRIIQGRNEAIRGVHRPDEMHIRRDVAVLVFFTLSQLQTKHLSSHIPLYEQHELPENHGQVSPVDLVNV